ncbi:MAG: pyridoxal phosphate-dependent aminotransferase [Dehalococcoidales bacterium]|nr:pyridoxal phosphate-dependent aminotransferase [Dehalococcoidales bacterium]
MKFSPLLDRIPDYPFRKVGNISKKAQEKDGVPVINARIGIPDREAPASVKEAMARYVLEEKSTFGYPCDVHPERGIPELIDAIIGHYRERHGVTLKPENIAVTGWTKDALFNIIRLFDRGTVQVPDPVYPVYEGTSILSGNEVVRVHTGADTGWLPEYRLTGSEGKDTVALYLCDPNNPTGSVAGRDYYETLLRDMEAADVAGIFDKAYKDYVFDAETKPLSITEIPGLMERGFEIVSLSKHFNFVGIGLGWIVSSEDNISRWLKLSSQYGQGVEWYKQKAGVDALTSPAVKAEMADYWAELTERRDVFTKGLQALGFSVTVPRATPYLWIKVPEGYDDEDFVLNTIIRRAHVALMPGSYFGANGAGYMRATIFLSIPEIEEALARIEKVKSW